MNSETDALVQWSGTRTLQSVTLTTRTFDYQSPSTAANPKGTTTPSFSSHGDLPQQLEVYEYTGAYTFGDQSRGDALSEIRMEEWESRAKRFEGAGAVRGFDAGHWFELDGHPQHDRDSQKDRQFAIIEARWFIENNLPVSSAQTQAFPHSLQGELAAIKAAHHGEREALTIKSMDGSVGFLLVQIEAQRRLVPYRSPFEHHKPKMRMQTAIVVGPANEEVYTDSLNRIKMRFHWDRLNAGDEKASCWLRVAMSDTGSGYGGVHVPRVGDDLKSDAFGAINASQGLYVSTHAKSAASQQLNVSEAHAQLTGAQNALDALSQASETHQAESLKDGSDALKTFASATQSTAQGATASGGNTAGGGTGSANTFTDPVMLMASPSGIALSTQQSAHIAAAQQVTVIGGQSVHVASGKSLIAGAVEKISLFVQRSGIKLFAGKGKVEVQAQADNVEITSQKTTRLISATENIDVAAKKEILLTSGGAYIRIKNGNIEIHAPGKIDVKGAQHSFNGPVRKNYPLPAFAQAETQGPVAFNMVLSDMPGPNGHPYINTPWRIVSARNADDALMSSDFVLSGKSDTSGKLALSEADQKTLHEAWKAAPGQIWVVYAGQVHSLALSRQATDWTDSDRFYEALDAMGYSQRMFVAQQGDVDQGFAQLARQEWQTDGDATLLNKLKGEG